MSLYICAVSSEPLLLTYSMKFDQGSNSRLVAGPMITLGVKLSYR